MINNISIATKNEIICIGDDVNIYPITYPRQLSFGETVLIGKKIPLFQIIFLSISCRQVWEFAHGHLVYRGCHLEEFYLPRHRFVKARGHPPQTLQKYRIAFAKSRKQIHKLLF